MFWRHCDLKQNNWEVWLVTLSVHLMFNRWLRLKLESNRMNLTINLLQDSFPSNGVVHEVSLIQSTDRRWKYCQDKWAPLFQYLIDSEKKLENRFDLPAGGLSNSLSLFLFSSSFPMVLGLPQWVLGSTKLMYRHGASLQIGGVRAHTYRQFTVVKRGSVIEF